MGMIHLYCGDGKGKTTAAMGLAVRMAGRGRKSVVVRFLKTDDSGEALLFERIPEIRMIPCGRSFGFSWQMDEEQKKEAAIHFCALFHQACREAKQQAEEGETLLVLDEVCAAVNGGFLPLSEVTGFLDSRPDSLEVVMTGRKPPEELLSRADYVTEMIKRKHPFDAGVTARAGIEY